MLRFAICYHFLQGGLDGLEMPFMSAETIQGALEIARNEAEHQILSGWAIIESSLTELIILRRRGDFRLLTVVPLAEEE